MNDEKKPWWNDGDAVGGAIATVILVTCVICACLIVIALVIRLAQGIINA